MTPEERARHFVVGSAGGDFNQDELIRSLAYEFRAAVAEEREACARAVCVGCENGWPAEDCDGDLLHVLPESLREPATQYTRGTHTGCEAAAIRART